MSESESAVIKPEALKTYVWLQCFDGSIQQVEKEVAVLCPVIREEIKISRKGSSKNHAIVLPERVSPEGLSLVLDYCRFHQVAGRSNKELKSFDEKFVRIDQAKLCMLANAAHALGLRQVINLTCGAFARIMRGKTPEEIRDIFHIPDDLTEEEKLEPVYNINDDPKIRMLNQLYAKKRKELQECQKLKDVQIQEEKKDERSLDQLLCFINGDGDSRGRKTSKNKKKKERRKDQAKNPAKVNSEPVNKEAASYVVPRKTDNANISSHSWQSPNLQDDIEYPFDDANFDDDGLDPAKMEEIYREVADFTMKLNLSWSERMILGAGSTN